MEAPGLRRSAQVIPVKKSLPGTLEVFVGFRTTKSFHHQWCCPGGNLDPGETSLEAAIRELEEETGGVITAAQLEFLRQTRPQYGDRQYEVDSFLLDASRVGLKNTSPDEHSTMVWTDVQRVILRHEQAVLENKVAGTVPVKLLETFRLLHRFRSLPLAILAQNVKANYAKA